MERGQLNLLYKRGIEAKANLHLESLMKLERKDSIPAEEFFHTEEKNI